MTVHAFGWSSVDVEDARKVGAKRAQRVVESGIGSEKKHDYEYGDTPVREEVVKRIDSGQTEVGLISRNRYGALVLNTTNVMFVDVDLPAPPAAGLLDSVLGAFSARRRKEQVDKTEAEVVDRIESWSSKNPGNSFRLYRTHSGFRLLFTDVLYDPKESDAKRILEELGSDVLYRRLTEKQECFRARLTPKPWRCGCRRPPSSFPRDGTEAELRYREWEDQYHEEIKGFSTCILRKEYGAPSGQGDIAKIIEIHDAMSLRDGAPLA